MENLYLMGCYKQQNKIWQLQIAGKDTTALQTTPNVKHSSEANYNEQGTIEYPILNSNGVNIIYHIIH